MSKEYFRRDDGIRLAVRFRSGSGPTIVFLPGYASDMKGDKATSLDAWAERSNRALLRFDYSGCGESEGRFEDGTISRWRDDARQVIDQFAPGPFILVGSSMGGWIGLLLAEAMPDRLVALIGIAAAPDFTRWTADASIFSATFLKDGHSNPVLDTSLTYQGPVRLLHGQCDDVVPEWVPLRTASALCSADVQITLIKDGDHRLSRPQDIELLVRTLESLGDPV